MATWEQVFGHIAGSLDGQKKPVTDYNRSILVAALLREESKVHEF